MTKQQAENLLLYIESLKQDLEDGTSLQFRYAKLKKTFVHLLRKT